MIAEILEMKMILVTGCWIWQAQGSRHKAQGLKQMFLVTYYWIAKLIEFMGLGRLLVSDVRYAVEGTRWRALGQGTPVKFVSLDFCEIFNRASKAQGEGPMKCPDLYLI
jgi:hypothetical protein